MNGKNYIAPSDAEEINAIIAKHFGDDAIGAQRAYGVVAEAVSRLRAPITVTADMVRSARDAYDTATHPDLNRWKHAVIAAIEGAPVIGKVVAHLYVDEHGVPHACDEGVAGSFPVFRAGEPLSSAPVSGSSNPDLAPSKCPITSRPFFMSLKHPELGMVPTYGGPFDSYTIPQLDGKPDQPWHERELFVHRYDHDLGNWVMDSTEVIPVRIIHESVLLDLQEAAASGNKGEISGVAVAPGEQARRAE
jgi:hypothetical protein